MIGVDIDGVLANYESSFIPLLIKASEGRVIVPYTYIPTCWNWHTALGFTDAEVKHAWAMRDEDESFWAELDERPEAREFAEFVEDELDPNVDVYFITDRPGKGAKLSTEGWLVDVGFTNPTVLISARKAALCTALNITHYIDDKNENCLSVYEEGCSKVFMCAQPWNSSINIPRGSLMDFAEFIRAN